MLLLVQPYARCDLQDEEELADSDQDVPPTPGAALRQSAYNPFSTQSAPAERMASFPELDYECEESDIEPSASAPVVDAPLASSQPGPAPEVRDLWWLPSPLCTCVAACASLFALHMVCWHALVQPSCQSWSATAALDSQNPWLLADLLSAA